MHSETLLLDLHLLWDRNNMEYIDISPIGICQVGSSSIRSFPFTLCKFSIKSNNRAWNKATNDKNSYCCDLTENFQFENILKRAGKSFSEVHILGSTNPQYDKQLFIDLPVQYMKTTS